MAARFTLSFAFICLFFNLLQGQSSKDVTVPLSAELALNPASITLNWPNAGTANVVVRRRKKGQSVGAWQQLVSQANTNLNTFTDEDVEEGEVYEYAVQQTTNGLAAFGYAYVAVHAEWIDSRGKVLIFVDSTTAAGVRMELDRLKNDLRGDGWWPVEFQVGPSASVQSVKDQILAAHGAEPNLIKSVLLLGAIPVPYSGNSAWDGHTPDHTGAWPCDAYYAELNGAWTDVTINNSVPNRAANKNIPGDGKFDQNFLPSLVELQIGRVDFSRINPISFGAADHVGLMKRYLDKNHHWRVGNYTVENKALVDDNFGYFGGEAFASNGYRNAYPLMEEANVINADFFDGTETQSYLLGYGCGGGNYNGANGVGSSANFATDSVNIVFSSLFGSYFGDWDFETNPFMPSALASRGGILTCVWAGRPHWFTHAMASGETIGFCARETMNGQFNTAFQNAFGKGGAHVALLGDPTLRAHVLKPATNLQLTNVNCQQVELSWTASADSVTGYHVYRAPAEDGPYTRLSTDVLQGNTYTDDSPMPGTLFYQVRAIREVSSPGGGIYFNNATGPIQSIEFALPPSVNASVDGLVMNCNNTPVQVQSGNSNPDAIFSWVGPNNFASALSNPIVSLPGVYVVNIQIGVCASTDSVEVMAASIPMLSTVVENETIPNANDGAIDLDIDHNSSTLIFLWSNGATTENLTGLSAGTYTVTVTDEATGCTAVANATVGIASGTGEAGYFEQFLLSPNPSKGSAMLALKLHKSATFKVEIQDMSGRLVWESPSYDTDAIQLPIDLKNRPAGLYNVSIRLGNQVFMRQLTLVR